MTQTVRPSDAEQAENAAEHAIREAWPQLGGHMAYDETDCFWEQVARVALRAADEHVRRDERHRLADLIEQHHAVLSGFVGDPERMVELVVFLLRLDKP